MLLLMYTTPTLPPSGDIRELNVRKKKKKKNSECFFPEPSVRQFLFTKVLF
jgi:hypothetical protein